MKTGKWIKIDTMFATCSNCKMRFCKQVVNKEFCPYCKAKMIKV